MRRIFNGCMLCFALFLFGMPPHNWFWNTTGLLIVSAALFILINDWEKS